MRTNWINHIIASLKSPSENQGHRFQKPMSPSWNKRDPQQICVFGSQSQLAVLSQEDGGGWRQVRKAERCLRCAAGLHQLQDGIPPKGTGRVAGWSQRAKTLLRGPQAQHLGSETERLPVVQNTCWYSDPKLRRKVLLQGKS